jgi:hypothetical protein
MIIHNIKIKNIMFTEEGRKKFRVFVFLLVLASGISCAVIGSILHWTNVDKTGIPAFVGLALIVGLMFGLPIHTSDFRIFTRHPSSDDKGHSDSVFELESQEQPPPKSRTM